jgi:hypothetical protein
MEKMVGASAWSADNGSVYHDGVLRRSPMATTDAKSKDVIQEPKPSEASVGPDFETITLDALIEHLSKVAALDSKWLGVEKAEVEWAQVAASIRRNTPPGWAPDLYPAKEHAAYSNTLIDLLHRRGNARLRENLPAFRRVLLEHATYMRDVFAKWRADQEKSRCRHGIIGTCPDCDNERFPAVPPGESFAARYDDPRHGSR